MECGCNNQSIYFAWTKPNELKNGSIVGEICLLRFNKWQFSLPLENENVLINVGGSKCPKTPLRS